jgi:NAD(P)-dependent dehydrogenase (short-subunit alcohol dehydrogenase family)
MSRGEYKTKTALVTGASQRLGRAIALGLAGDGWDIAVHFHRSRLPAQTLVDEIEALGRKAATVSCDLSNAAAATGLIGKCAAKLGTISCLVNNAALFEFDDLASLEAASMDRHFGVNLRAPVLLAQALAAQLPAVERGCIVNLIDQKVFNPNPDFLSYTLTKIGLEGATSLLAMALAPRIRVCGVAPGITLASGKQSAPGFARAHKMAPLGRSSDMGDIVEAVRFLVKAKSITGETILVDGGQHLWKLKRDVQFETGKN